MDAALKATREKVHQKARTDTKEASRLQKEDPATFITRYGVWPESSPYLHSLLLKPSPQTTEPKDVPARHFASMFSQPRRPPS